MSVFAQKEYDTVICGAGPAGLLAAYTLGRLTGSARRVLLLDKKEPWKEPIFCAEAVSTDRLASLWPIDPDFVRSRLSGNAGALAYGCVRVLSEEPFVKLLHGGIYLVGHDGYLAASFLKLFHYFRDAVVRAGLVQAVLIVVLPEHGEHFIDQLFRGAGRYRAAYGIAYPAPEELPVFI